MKFSKNLFQQSDSRISYVSSDKVSQRLPYQELVLQGLQKKVAVYMHSYAYLYDEMMTTGNYERC